MEGFTYIWETNKDRFIKFQKVDRIPIQEETYKQNSRSTGFAISPVTPKGPSHHPASCEDTGTKALGPGRVFNPPIQAKEIEKSERKTYRPRKRR